MGAIGVTGSLASNKLAKEADLIICVGTRLADFPTASKSAFQNPDVQFLSINVSSFDAMKLDSTMLVADAKEALIALQQKLEQSNYKVAYQAEQLQTLKAEWDSEVDRLYSLEREDGLVQTRVLGELNSFLGKEDVIVCAAGSLPGDLHRVWRSEAPQTYHMEYGFSCMGYEVSGAFGVKLAHPHREVYSFVGDGSFLMLHSELLTSIQEGKKINVILLNNHGFQCIHNLQRGHGSNGFGNEFRFREEESGRLTGGYMPIDFSLIAQGLGVKAFSATTIDELRSALESAKKEESSTLIEIRVLPGTNTGDYESWWRVGVAEVSESEKVNQASDKLGQKLLQIKPY